MTASNFRRLGRYNIARRVSVILGLTLLLLLPIKHLLARSNGITLLYLRADCLAGLPEVFISWETVRELDIAGFFVTRSLTATVSYMRISEFIPGEGNSLSSAVYEYIDDTTMLNQTYYYRLEVINSDQSLTLYGPISITAGADSTSMLFIPRMYLPLTMHTD